MRLFHASKVSGYRLPASLCLVACLCASGIGADAYAAPSAQQTEATTTQTTAKVNVNTADADMLASVKGIGSTRAKAIVEYRQQHGDFKSLQDLLNVHGIGSGILKRIEPNLTVGS